METLGSDRMYGCSIMEYTEAAKLKLVKSDASTASGSLGADALCLDDITFDACQGSDSGATDPSALEDPDLADALEGEPVDLDLFAAEKAEHERLKHASHCYDAMCFESFQELSKLCSESSDSSTNSD